MPTPSFIVSTEIRAEPGAVFAYVSDLSKHGEWAGNELHIQPVDNAPIVVGKKYRSLAVVGGREFHADLVVTEFDPPHAFGFAGRDATGKFSHRFVLERIENRTRLTRQIHFELSLAQYVFYLLALQRVRLPVARAALEKLKSNLEHPIAS